MWLIDTQTEELREFTTLDEVQYVILSHTWETEEVEFWEMTHNKDLAKRKQGYRKIEQTCKLARDRGIPYAWVDTCCIDKNSSAALSEAINSMFFWYKQSSICFAYLSDLKLPVEEFPDDNNTDGIDSDEPNGQEREMVMRLSGCRWFTRGWTLQELIAPEVMEFYDGDWKFVGTKSFYRREICHITGIDVDVLEASEVLANIPIGRRMSWAATRQTTRMEDMAYCLLGIFDVNMPMIYGEGPKAFQRLQEQIVMKTNDLSLFAWTAGEEPVKDIRPVSMPQHIQDLRGIFARSPAEFANCRNLRTVRDLLPAVGEFSVTNNGLKIEAYLHPGVKDDYIFGLDCINSCVTDEEQRQIGIYLRKTNTGYVRSRASELFTASEDRFLVGKRATVYIQRDLTAKQASNLWTQYHSSILFHFHTAFFGVQKLIAYPKSHWDVQGRHFLTKGSKTFTGYLEFSIKPKYWKFVIVCGLLDAAARDPPTAGERGKAHNNHLIPWAAIFTDQEPRSKTQLEIIKSIVKSGDEANLAKLRRKVLGWYLNVDGRLPITDMVAERKQAFDDDGEVQYYVTTDDEFIQRNGARSFRIGVYVEELVRLTNLPKVPPDFRPQHPSPEEAEPFPKYRRPHHAPNPPPAADYENRHHPDSRRPRPQHNYPSAGIPGYQYERPAAAPYPAGGFGPMPYEHNSYGSGPGGTYGASPQYGYPRPGYGPSW